MWGLGTGELGGAADVSPLNSSTIRYSQFWAQTTHSVTHRTALYCAASDAVLHYTILYALHINAPHYTALHCTVVIDCI